MNNGKGTFITLEGMEGAGKSTHLTYIAGQLRKTAREIVVTREPGGTAFGEQVRHLLLMQKSLAIDGMPELLLMLAARAQHVREVISPALHLGKIVLCDRFIDSSYAYQGGGRGIAHGVISQLAQLTGTDIKPDLTLLFDIPVTTGLQRACRDREADRFEQETFDFFQSVRNTYLKIAEHEPERIKLVNTNMPVNAVHTRILEILQEHDLC